MLKRSSSPDAEALAITALTFLAEDAARLSRFLDMTGIHPSEIRAVSQSPAFFAAILDHLLTDEGLLLTFAANHQIKPEAVAQASRSLAPEALSLNSK